MADFVASLVDMGFPKEKAQKAVEVTGNVGVEPAMEWILANANNEEPGSSSAPASVDQQRLSLSTSEKNPTDGNTSADQGSEEQESGNAPASAEAKSLKCEDCGKLFKGMEEVEFHAAKTNHSNFSESTEEKKPLTEEEKQKQKELLMEKLKIKRQEREEREKKEQIEREKNRIKSGKDFLEAKKKMDELEMQRIIEARRREKLEDKLARERVKAQIEADKLARKAKFAAGGNSNESSTTVLAASPPNSASPSTTAQNADSEAVVKKDYKEAKLQIRLTNGKPIVQTFGANEPLAAVRLFVELNRTDGVTEKFNLMTNFPRRVFQGEDYDMPLDALGLVPSAVLTLTKL